MTAMGLSEDRSITDGCRSATEEMTKIDANFALMNVFIGIN